MLWVLHFRYRSPRLTAAAYVLLRKVFNDKDCRYTMSNEIKAIIFDLYDTLLYIANETKPYTKLFLNLSLQPAEFKQAKAIALTEDFADLSGLVKRIKPGKN